MKKLFTLLLVVSGSLTFAQSSLVCEEGSSVTVWESSNENSFDVHLYITNTSGSSNDYYAVKDVITDVTGAMSTYCWGPLCYPPTTDTSAQVSTIAAGATNETFKISYYPNGTNDTYVVRATFFNAADETDKIEVLVTINTTPAGVVATVENNKLASITPNPASSFTTVNYKTNDSFNTARLDVFNMLGAKVKSLEVFELEGKQIIETSDLDNGVYMISLIVDNQSVSTQRLMVNK